MRIMVSGSREYTNYECVRRALEDAAGDARIVTVVHGAARGADSLAQEVAEEYGFKVEAHPADWTLGKRGGNIRNSEMLVSGIDVALFFFDSALANAGTRDAAKKAIGMEIPSRYFVDNDECDIKGVKRLIRPF
jgi:hypothetical protein